MVVSPVAKFLVITAACIIVIAGMKSAEAILVPFFLSLFIAVICTPPLLWLQRRGIPNALALLLIVLMIVFMSVFIVVIVGSSVAEFRDDIPLYQQRLTEITADLFAKLNSMGIPVDLAQIEESFNPNVAFSLVGTTLASFGNLMTNAFLILLTVVFILAEEVRFTDKLMRGKSSEKTQDAIEKFKKGIHQYVAIKTLVSLLTGFTIMIWLWVLNVDYFVLWGLLAFLLNFVPTLGSILAAVPAVLLALVQLGVGDALLAGLGFVLVNFIVGNVIEPRVMGRGLNLSPLVVFLSLVFWGWVLGPVGMLLSIPLTMTVKIALESFDETRWVGAILSSGVAIDSEIIEAPLQLESPDSDAAK